MAERGHVARFVVQSAAGRIGAGALAITEGAGHSVHGRGPTVIEVEVLDARAYRAVATGGAAGLGRGYIEGWWRTEDLVGLVRMLIGAMRPSQRYSDRLAAMISPAVDPLTRLRRRVGGDRRKVDRDNIAAHYDLSNDFFSLMLDETMTYSCGWFETSDQSLADAQRAKIDRLVTSLQLQPSDHLVEIGAGWGALAVRVAEAVGCRVTTTTISAEQHAFVSKLVAERGVSDLVDVRADHYLDLEGRYDALVSVEMIEAVAWWDLDRYFERCAELVRPGGRVALQSIVIADAAYERAKRRVDFIKRYVFPGGNLPSVTVMTRSAAAAGLDLETLQDMDGHYAETLRRWRSNLAANAELVRTRCPSLDDDRFRRLWAMYLAYCEAAFEERQVRVVQATWRREKLPATPSQRMPRRHSLAP